MYFDPLMHHPMAVDKKLKYLGKITISYDQVSTVRCADCTVRLVITEYLVNTLTFPKIPGASLQTLCRLVFDFF